MDYPTDDGDYALARRLAAQRGCTIREAIRAALRETLARDDKLRRTEAILAELDAAPALRPGFTDKDLYDENGLPIL